MKACPTRRKRMRSDNLAMRRARRLYAKLCHATWQEVPDKKRAEWLDAIAAAGIRRGLYHPGTPTRVQKQKRVIPKGAMNNARYSLCRQWCRIEYEDCGEYWYQWIAENGIAYLTFEFIGRRMRLVA